MQDPGNVGAIVRTAEACGATGVVSATERRIHSAGRRCAARWEARFACRSPRQSLADAIAGASATPACAMIATTPRGGTPLRRLRSAAPAAIMLGSEGPGLPDELVEAADERFTIPMQPPVESLNVAVAAALVLYEAARQRLDAALDVAL